MSSAHVVPSSQSTTYRPKPVVQVQQQQQLPRLITIRFSHYNEKARWALDRFSVRYVETPYMPLLHTLPVIWHTRLIGRSDRISSRASTPVLLTSSGGCVCDSTDIMSYVSGKYSTSATSLYPTAKVRDLVRLYSSRLGPRTRRIAYYYILQDVKLFVRLSKLNCGPRQATLIKRLFSLGSSYLRNSLGVSKTHVTRDMKYVCEEFDSVSAMLSDGRKYLTHNRFTAADLTFACMAAPVLMVTVEEGYGGRLPYMHEMTHPALKQFVKQIKTLRQTPAGKFALRMFREERGTRILPCYPLLTPMSKL